MHPPQKVSRITTWIHGLRARLRFGRTASVDRAGIGLLGYRSVFYSRALRNYRGKKTLLWETTYDTLLPTFAKDAEFRVIALPHNLEALVSEQSFSDLHHDDVADLSAELQRLRLADAIFAISKEEQWFLEANQIPSHYLPFFPDETLAESCLSIRAERIGKANSAGHVSGPLLVLGSAFNPATCRGMAEQLRCLGQDAPTAPSTVVIGPDTDKHLAQFRSPRVQILGGVSRPVLADILASCSALLIHTQGGAGAVTRIPEALLNGIPIIANINAARDQHGMPGVHVYADSDEFMALVHTSLPMPPPPPRPLGAEKRFQQELLRRIDAVSNHA